MPSSLPVIAAQLFAVGLAVWARRSFPTGTFRVTAVPAAHDVIQRGPYRLIRHPMYTAALLLIWAAVLSHSSVMTVGVGILVTVLVFARILIEERLLVEQAYSLALAS
ncbi:MAG TPA: methyltransferase [Thermoanaerobaculia bacterium]|nr:methyltransferase [Thermoanaerobaculia bacterium]